MAVVDREHPAYRGQAAYTRGMLAVYDALVYGFTSPLVWRCRKDKLLDLYDRYVAARHLDIGVATGRLLDDCRFPVPTPDITLMDLNRRPLVRAAGRLKRYAPETLQANVLEPWDVPSGMYGSIGMSYLLHCLPGTMPEKAIVFEYARRALVPDGVLFGATLLGDRGYHTSLSWAAMVAMNRRGVLSNLSDRLVDLDRGLAQVFGTHHVKVQGTVALFTARVAS